MKEFFQYENQLHLNAKRDILVCLNDSSKAQSEAPRVSSVVIDGAAIVQMLKPGGAETFKQYADQVFLPYILGQLQHASRLDLVWDSYKADSLKATARAECGKGVCWCVAGSVPITGNWQGFLRVYLNKMELFCFLSKALVE